MKIFLLMAVVQFLNYTNLVVNTRAIAHRKYRWAVGTDVAASAFTFLVVTKIAADSSYAGLFGMMLGGGVSSLLGIYLTKHWGEDHVRQN